MGRCPERQRGRTVNPLAQPSQVRVLPGPLGSGQGTIASYLTTEFAHVAQTVERILGKDVAMGSIPIVGFVKMAAGGG